MLSCAKSDLRKRSLSVALKGLTTMETLLTGAKKVRTTCTKQLYSTERMAPNDLNSVQLYSEYAKATCLSELLRRRQEQRVLTGADN